MAGHTLYTGVHAQKAFLVAMDGTVVHEWHVPYRAVWAPGGPVRRLQPSHHIYWRKAHVFPNGDLLALITAADCAPWGYGLVKVDRQSRVLWKFPGHAHDDFEVAPNGRIFTLTHRWREEPVPDVRRHPIVWGSAGWCFLFDQQLEYWHVRSMRCFLQCPKWIHLLLYL